MPLDPSIALQVQTPSPTNLVSSFIDLGQKKLNLDKSRATYGADVAQRNAESSSSQSAATVNAASVQPAIAANVATSQSAQNAAAYSKFQLTGVQQQKGVDIATGLVTDPDFVKGNTDGMLDKLNDAGARMVAAGIDPKIADANVTALKYQALHNPMQVQQSLKNMILGGQSAQGQGASIAPSGIPVSNGQQSSVVNTAPLAGPVGAPIPGTTQQQQLPPTATTMGPNGQPGYVGPQAPAQPGAAPIPSGPAIGQVEGTTGPIQTNNAHFAQVQQDAKDASNRIAGLQNISQELPKAWSGGGEAGNWIRRIGQIFGNTDQNTAQDLIAKNLSQIASAGGATDAARTLTEMGNPGVHVTKDAAIEAVSQLMGVEAKKQAASTFFAGTPTNSADYTNKLTMWNKYADPRAFQYAALPPAEQAAMKAKMKQAGTWASLNNSMTHLAGMGVEP